jgi:hypothetical protein
MLGKVRSKVRGPRVTAKLPKFWGQACVLGKPARGPASSPFQPVQDLNSSYSYDVDRHRRHTQTVARTSCVFAHRLARPEMANETVRNPLGKLGLETRPFSLVKTRKTSKSLAIYLAPPSCRGMLALISELLSWLAGRFRSRSELELKVIALRHQMTVLRRQCPGPAPSSSR